MLSTILFPRVYDILRLAAGRAQAAGIPSSPPTAIPNPLIYGSIPELLDHLLSVLLLLSGTVVVIMIAYAGLLYIISTGDPTRRKKATETLKYAVIGFAIIASARVIVSIVTGFIP